jgi:hypothetical protein
MIDQQQEQNGPSRSENLDIDRLADEVYRLLLRELRIEQERQPITSRRLFTHTRRNS